MRGILSSIFMIGSALCRPAGVAFALGPVDCRPEQILAVGLKARGGKGRWCRKSRPADADGVLFGSWTGRIAAATTGSMRFGTVNPRC
jgi:hypothetical protein